MPSLILFYLASVLYYLTTYEHFVHGAIVVTTTQGRVRGTTAVSSDGTVYNIFYGIPYARPPINDLRFQPPVELIEPWEGELNATQKPQQCPQSVKDAGVVGSEDCLNLNVYAPANAEPGDDLPVIVFVVGGGFYSGNSTEYAPCSMMNKNRNVIVVQPNYRLGVMGLLSTGDSVLPGNLQLKDQTVAFKWVKRNIRSFGGDPNRVTLHGHSSGAMNAHVHMLSPLSKGLFHRIILQSGTSALPMAYFDTETSRNLAFEFGRLLNCGAKTSEALLKCLLTVKAEDLITTQDTTHRMWMNYFPPNGGCRPTVEDANNPGSFLTEIPIRASYQDANVTMMIGMTTGEAAELAEDVFCNGDESVQQLNTQYEVLLPIIVSYHWTAKFKECRYVSRLLKKHYFGDSQMNNSTLLNLTQMLTDGMYGFGISNVIRAFKGRKYLYLFDYMVDYYTRSAQKCFPRHIAVSHNDDLELIHCKTLKPDHAIPIDLILGEELVTRYVNFVHSGDPDKPQPINTTIFGEWKPVRSNRYEYLYINYNGTMRNDFRRDSYRFWKALPINSKYS